ncbi:MAG: MBL fold metallo-hydrolase [Clostridiales bacterium]|nr:MBL fold metallo-hydrolase [Clostridiales bacterium]
MKLICLGVNGPFPAPEGATSGYLASHGNTGLQLDMGSGTLAALTRHTAPEQLTALLLSHWHYDHCSDVLPLIYRMESLMAQGVAPLNVYAPMDEGSPVRQALLASPAFSLHEVKPGDTLQLGDVQVQVGLARHPVPAVMYRLTADGRSLCYTGDTNVVEGMEDFARGCDLLLVDGLFPAGAWNESKPHLSAALAARLANDAQAGRVVITHLNPGIDPVGLLAEARAVRPDALLAERFASYEV